jgi:hypothetical protein
LLTLASAQFLMTLDASVMNVSIATVGLFFSQRLPPEQPQTHAAVASP